MHMIVYIGLPKTLSCINTCTRKRKIGTNPPRGLKRSEGVTTTDPKSVCPSDRVKAYPNTLLKVRNKFAPVAERDYY